MGSSKFKIPRHCAFCGRFFMAKTISSYYCSRQCTVAAFNEKKKRQRREARRIKLIKELKKSRQEYITITNAVALFDVSRNTIRRRILDKKVMSRRVGQKKIFVRWRDLESLYPLNTDTHNPSEQKLFDLNPDKCYTIGEITERFGVSEKTVYTHIRQFSIPIRQIGKFVYAPKQEIDNLYKNIQ